MFLSSCGGGDPTAMEMVREWRGRAGESFGGFVDRADIVVAARVVRAEGCPAVRVDEGKLACGTLRPIQVLRGDLADGDVEVQYWDHRGGPGASGLRRMPLGPDGTAGIYFLARRGTRVWASVAEARSYISVAKDRYVRVSGGPGVRDVIAANLLRGGEWGLAEASDGGLRVSEAIQLVGLFPVRDALQRMSLAADPAVAAGGCVILTAQFGRFDDCVTRLKRAGGLSPELLAALERSEVEGEIYLEWIRKRLGETGPVILEGLMNAAPGGGCEFVRLQLQHQLAWMRELAKVRVREACG